MSATIAALIPVHNKAAHVGRALRSVLAQTSPPDEIIVIDDASTDDSMRIVRDIVQDVPQDKITFLRRETPGPGGYAARNHGIAAARSEWIAFLDADDAWTPGHLAHARDLIAARDDGLGAVFASRLFIFGENKSKHQSAVTQGAETLDVDFDGYLRLWRALGFCPNLTCATILRKDALVAAGGFPADRCRRGGDKDTWLRVMERTRAVCTAFEGATYYADVPGQVTQSVSFNQRHCVCDTLLDLMARADKDRNKLLRYVFNSEIMKYVRYSAARNPIDASVYRGFYVLDNPVEYAMIRAIALTPTSLRRALIAQFGSS